MLFKVDFTKVYDCINWDFLDFIETNELKGEMARLDKVASPLHVCLF